MLAQEQKKVNKAAYNNAWYDTGAGPVKRALWFMVNALFFINPLNPFRKLKVFLLRAFGAKVGVGVDIKPGVNIKYPWLLTVGDHVWIGENVWIDNLARVVLQPHVTLSQGAMLLTGSHDYRKPAFDLLVAGITLEEGVWIGAKAMVCPGVTCGSHSVLAAGSVATGAMQPFGIHQGNPATEKRKRELAL